MEHLELLGSLARQLHQEFRNLYFVLLPIAFTLSLTLTWFRHPMGSPDFIDIIKRACIATLLLVAFPEISDTILFVTTGIAQKINDMSGLQAFWTMAKEKVSTYSVSSTSVLFGINDLIVATITYLSFVIVLAARYILVSLYYFTWIFLSITSPLLLLFHLFTSTITLNLFVSLIEVACWQIVWAILSAMLQALPYGAGYMADGDYLTVILLNLVIAFAMIGTPFLVKSLVKGGLASFSGSLAPIMAATVLAVPAKGAAIAQMFKSGPIANTMGFMRSAHSKFVNGPPISDRIKNHFSPQMHPHIQAPPNASDEIRKHLRGTDYASRNQ